MERCFPDAAALYLYRDPIEVIATVLQETTAVLRAMGHRQAYALTGLSPHVTGSMSDVEYLAHCYANYFNVVLNKTGSSRLHLVNYSQLMDSESFADILTRGFNLRPDDAELAQMRKQYCYYSKDDSDRTIFTGDAATMLDILPWSDKQIIGEICSEGLTRLDASGWNLYPSA